MRWVHAMQLLQAADLQSALGRRARMGIIQAFCIVTHILGRCSSCFATYVWGGGGGGGVAGTLAQFLSKSIGKVGLACEHARLS